LADIISLRITIVTLALVMLLSSFVFSYSVWKPNKKSFYRETNESEGISVEGK